jgi:nucleoside-diphosphate kinase
MQERTLIAFKGLPTDAMTYDLLKRIHKHNFSVESTIARSVSRVELAKFYEHIKERPFFSDMLDCYTQKPWFILVLSGEDIISVMRQEVGSTVDPAPGTMRYAFGVYDTPGVYYNNKVHCSDSPESFKRECSILLGCVSAVMV